MNEPSTAAGASEVHGLTLRLAGGANDRVAQYVRLAVVRRRGFLFGWSYNVREARATWGESPGDGPLALGEGRLLSWRWQGRDDAEALYATREQTFVALGYEAVEDRTAGRGRWDWLRDLAKRQLVHSPDADPAARLARAFETLELSPEQRCQGIANVLSMTTTQLREPSRELVCRLDPPLLELMLELMLRDPDAELRAVGTRWLHWPETAFQLDTDTLLRWCEDLSLADALAVHVRDHGLALAGPTGLQQLARSPHVAVHTAARGWLNRVQCPPA